VTKILDLVDLNILKGKQKGENETKKKQKGKKKKKSEANLGCLHLGRRRGHSFHAIILRSNSWTGGRTAILHLQRKGVERINRRKRKRKRMEGGRPFLKEDDQGCRNQRRHLRMVSFPSVCLAQPVFWGPLFLLSQKHQIFPSHCPKSSKIPCACGISQPNNNKITSRPITSAVSEKERRANLSSSSDFLL